MSDFTFGENPNMFELDLGDGKGLREMFYTLNDKTVWVEPDGLGNQSFDQDHESLIDGLLPVREHSKTEIQQLIWRLSRPFREYFDVIGTGGEPAQLPSQADPTLQSQNGNLQGQQEDVHFERMASERQPTPEYIPPAMEMPYLNVDIETYAALKYAPLIENQALIIDTYELLMRTHLEPDNPAHEMVEMLRDKSKKLMETYYETGESEPGTVGTDD